MIVNGTPGDDNLDGGDDDDTIHGGQGNDILSGLAGKDTVHGDEGDDTLYPGDGDDSVFGGDGDDFIWDFDGPYGIDTIDGGAGSDTLYYSAQSRLVVVLAGPNPSTVFDSAARATIVNIENVLVDGNTRDDITGDSFANRLSSGRGNDRLAGMDGDDDLLGMNQNDSIFGGKGDDTVGGGNDNDTLKGGPGKDSFVFEGARPRPVHADEILDFGGKDKIGLDPEVFAKLNDGGKLKAKYFSIGDAKDGNDFINYDRGSGELAYDEDGSGGRAPHVFFTLKGAPHLDAGDIIILA